MCYKVLIPYYNFFVAIIGSEENRASLGCIHSNTLHFQRGIRDVYLNECLMWGLAGAFIVPHGCMGIWRSGGAKWMLCWFAADNS